MQDRKGFKQICLAEQLGKSYNMVNSYAQNRQQPRLEVLHDIAKILDIDVVELIVSSKKKWVRQRNIMFIQWPSVFI